MSMWCKEHFDWYYDLSNPDHGQYDIFGEKTMYTKLERKINVRDATGEALLLRKNFKIS